jgi:hypothetical protein
MPGSWSIYDVIIHILGARNAPHNIGAVAQSVDPPRYSVGDTWTLSTGRIVKVVTVEGDFVVIRSHVSACPSCLVYFDKNLNSMRVTTHNGEPIDPTDRRHNYVGSAWKWFDWPLKNGKSWGFWIGRRRVFA